MRGVYWDSGSDWSHLSRCWGQVRVKAWHFKFHLYGNSYFLAPPPHSAIEWELTEGGVISSRSETWGQHPAPLNASSTTDWHWHSHNSCSVQASKLSSPVIIHIRVPVMMFSQWLIINTEFLIVILMRTDTRPSQANNVNQLSQLCSNQQSLPPHTWEYFKFTW